MSQKEVAEKYLSNGRLLSKEAVLSNNPDAARKFLVYSSKAATKLLDNESMCLLLEENYTKYSELMQCEIEKIKADLNLKPSRNLNVQLNLDNIKVNDVVSSLSCSNTPVCTQSESISENDVHEFITLFRQRPNTSKLETESDNKNRKIAKSFAPRSCNSVERKPIRNKVQSEVQTNGSCFKTAAQELDVQNAKKYGTAGNTGVRKKLGTRRGVQSKFVSPVLSNGDIGESAPKSDEWPSDQEVDERLKNIEPKMVELIRSEIMDNGPVVNWDDIAGLEFAKTAIQEAVVWPMLRPDIFTGLRRPPKGILLFGPPGTGKTLIGKCIASQSKSTFFSISASSLTSKWIGDGEKMVRALFSVARCHQPAVIFIDEIDSLLSQRSETEHESSRRIKTEFLVQLDGATTDSEERLLVVGATNRPQELDEAARRRFVKRLYIPLPETEARRQLVQQLMHSEKHVLAMGDIREIANLTDGYSGADMKNLCCEASLGPIRSLDIRLMERIEAAEVRPVCMEDFQKALVHVRASVAEKDLEQYVVWNRTYGSGGGI